MLGKCIERTSQHSVYLLVHSFQFLFFILASGVARPNRTGNVDFDLGNLQQFHTFFGDFSVDERRVFGINEPILKDQGYLAK